MLHLFKINATFIIISSANVSIVIACRTCYFSVVFTEEEKTRKKYRFATQSIRNAPFDGCAQGEAKDYEIDKVNATILSTLDFFFC